MLTPFETSFVEEFITNLPQYIDETNSEDIVSFLHEQCFKKGLPWEDDSIENAEDFPPLELSLCYKIWVGACFLDAYLNHTDYNRETLRYTEQYQESIKSLGTALNKSKKKLFKSIPIYNTPEIVQDAIHALDYLLIADSEDETGNLQLSELGEEMQKTNQLEDFESSVIELQRRLLDHTE